MSDRQPVIVFALFPGVTQLDFTGPHQVFSSLPGAEVILASAAGGTIETGGITFAGLRRLAEIPACDVVCVPGGRGVTDNAIDDEAFLARIAPARRDRAVCDLGVHRVAGARRGRAAARQARRLPLGLARPPGAVRRDPRPRRGWCATARSSPAAGLPPGSISRSAWSPSSPDPETAQAIQLQIEYAPAPPFDAGRPETAPPAILARVRERNQARAAQRRATVEAAARRAAAYE